MQQSEIPVTLGPFTLVNIIIGPSDLQMTKLSP